MEAIVNTVIGNVNSYIQSTLKERHSSVSENYVAREVHNRLVMLREGMLEVDSDAVASELSERICRLVELQYEELARYQNTKFPTHLEPDEPAATDSQIADFFADGVFNPEWVGKSEKTYPVNREVGNVYEG